MVRITIMFAFFLCLSTSVRAEDGEPPDPQSYSSEQLQKEMDQIRKQIEQHVRSPEAPKEWKEYQQIKEKLNESLSAAERKKLDERQSKLYDVVTEWRNKETELVWRRNRLEAEHGKRVFQARHAELMKQPPTATPQLRSLGFDVLNYPRIDGSTSSQPLVMLITCRCFDVAAAWETRARSLLADRWEAAPGEYSEYVHHSFGGEPEADLFEFALKARPDNAKNERLATIINRLLATNASTHNAYVNIIQGKSDVGLIARPPSSEELELARMNNVELDVTPCALDAFVFLVNRENPIRSLTSAQIRDIYTDKIEQWKAVGGKAGWIRAYQREENSGSQQLMRSLVMKDVPLSKPSDQWRPRQLVGHMMSSVFLELTRDEQGIGYSVYYYERFMSGSPGTKTIAVDGIEPTSETIRTRKYPYVTEVFVVTQKGLDPASPAAKWRNWLLSPEGQAVVQESGYVPLPSPAVQGRAP